MSGAVRGVCDGTIDPYSAELHFPHLNSEIGKPPPSEHLPGTPYVGPWEGVFPCVRAADLHTGGGIGFERYWVVATASTTDYLLIEILAWIRRLVRRKPESNHHDQGPPDPFQGF